MEAVAHHPARHRFRKRHAAIAFVVVLVIALIAGRLYLPIWLKDYVNEQLNNIKGYRGGVDAIDVHLYRGAYSIRGLKLNKLNAGVPVPFLAIDTTDLSLQWGALFDGRIVSDVHLYGPTINFAKGKGGAEQTGKETNWNEPIKKLMPIDINLVEIQRGKIAYRDFGSNPPVDIYVNNLNGTLNDLRNTEDKNVALPSSINFTGDSIGKGKLGLKGKLNVLTPEIDMDLDGKLENADLTAFNSFSNAAAGLNFKGGKMDLYTEMAIKSGQVTGYVKPIVRDLSVDRVPKDTNPFQVVWSTVASFLIEVFTNHPHDQFATKVPLRGSLDKIETRFWPTLGGIFRNAFVEAFSKGTDNEIEFKGSKPITSEKRDSVTPAAASQALNPEDRRREEAEGVPPIKASK